MSDHLTVGDLTTPHLGRAVYGIPGIAGWEEYLVLVDVRHDETHTYLGFRWNDDDVPANTERGKFAVGRHVPNDTPCRVGEPA